MPHLKGFRFAREIIAYVVWAHHRFDMSTADVEELPTGRDVVVSQEAIGLWVIGFARHFAEYVRRDRPAPCDKWHADEVVISIQGVKHWLWLVIDAHGNMLDILVQPRQNTKAAKRSLHSLTARFGKSRVAVGDKLPSYL